MNERIRKLAEQCRIEEYSQHGDLIEFGFDEEKFAELIIKECADIAKHHVMNISTYADAEFVRTDSAEFVEEQIQKHFGVQE